MTFTENQILVYFLFGVIALIGLIFAIKVKLAERTTALLAKNEEKIPSIKIKKYSEVNVFQFRKDFFRVGLIYSLSCVILVFSWVKYEPVIDPDLLIDYSCELDSLHFGYPSVPPPPLPPPIKIEVVPNEAIIEAVEFNENSVISFHEKNHFDNQIIPSPPPLPVEIEETENFDQYLDEEIDFNAEDFIEKIKKVVAPIQEEEDFEEEICIYIVEIMGSL